MTSAVPEIGTCIYMRTKAICDDTPIHSTSCSKTAGLGIRLAKYSCVDESSGQEFERTCIDPCCCEKTPGECTRIDSNHEPVIVMFNQSIINIKKILEVEYV